MERMKFLALLILSLTELIDGCKRISCKSYENFGSCETAPSLSPQQACSLKKDMGTCNNFTVKFFFDIEYGACSRFWYGGCDGNNNRFDSNDDCRDVCEQPKGSKVCELPKVVGACTAYYPVWYYDSDRNMCSQFIYGGCLGNANRFEKIEDCQSQCVVDEKIPKNICYSIKNQNCTNIKVNIASWNGIQYIIAENNQIVELRSNSFEDGENVKLIKLDRNKISNIEQNSFDGQQSLQELYLQYNKISELKPSTFRNLTKLKVLCLRGNLLSRLDETLFAKNKNLQKLNLSQNKIVELKPGVFRNLVNLEKLWLNENMLTEIPEKFLESNENLKYLSMSENEIPKLHPNTFKSLLNLEELFLYSNQLTDIPEDLFSMNGKVKNLSLSMNKLFQLKTGVLVNLLNLEIIWLHNNRLTTIQEGQFKTNGKLKELQINENKLMAIHSDAFQSLNIDILNLSNNLCVNPSKNLFRDVMKAINQSSCYSNYEKMKEFELETRSLEMEAVVILPINIKVENSSKHSTQKRKFLGQDFKTISIIIAASVKTIVALVYVIVIYRL